MDQKIIDNLRLLVGEDFYTDKEIWDIYSNSKNVTDAAYNLWSGIAAKTVTLVNTSESGSSRAMSQIHTNAVAQAERFKKLMDQGNDPTNLSTRRARVGHITRP